MDGKTLARLGALVFVAVAIRSMRNSHDAAPSAKPGRVIRPA